MLYIERASSKSEALKLFDREDAVFRWRSGGGGEAVIITENPSDEAERLTKEIYDFMEKLKRFAQFDFRFNNGVVEIAITPDRKGWWIGKKGGRIRALSKHLDIKINLVFGVFCTDLDMHKNIIEQGEYTDSKGNNIKVLHLSKVNLDNLFWKASGPDNKMDTRMGLIAPWKVK